MKKLFNIGVIYSALFLIFLLLFAVSAWIGSFTGLLLNALFLGVITLRVSSYIKEEIEKTK